MRKLALLILSCAALRAQNPPSYNQLRIIPNPTRTAVGVEQFYDKPQAHYVGLSAPDAVVSNLAFRLPGADGASGDCMTTNGALSWAFLPCAGGSTNPVSSTNPLYLYSHFRDDDQTRIYFSKSFDAYNFSDVNPQGVQLAPSSRDPSIIYVNGLYYICASPDASPNTWSIPIWSTADFITFSAPTYIDVSVLHGPLWPMTYGASFAPEWFIDPVSGNIFLTETNSVDTTMGFDFWLQQINFPALTVAASTLLTVNGTVQHSAIDSYLFYSPGNTTYYMMYADQTGSPFGQTINYATSTTLTGTYTEVGSPGNDYFGFTTQSEAPSVLALPNGCWRVYADTWLNAFNPGQAAPRKYQVKFRDSCSMNPFDTLEGTGPVPINIDAAEHGTVLKVIDPVAAVPVTNASQYYHNNGVSASRLCLGCDLGTIPFYTMQIVSKNADGFLQFDEPPAYAALQSNGDASVLAGCGTTDVTCPFPAPGVGTWLVSYNGGGGGLMQFNNTNPNTGESSISFLSGGYSFGGDSKSASGLSTKALWTIGENNQFFGPNDLGNNSDNNWLFAYNRGLGPLTSSITVTNPSFESGLTGWTVALGSASVSTAQAYTGTHSISLDASADVIGDNLTVTANTVYIVTAWIYADPGAIVGAQLYADDTMTGNQVFSDVFVPSGTWYQVGIRYFANSTSMRVALLRGAASSGNIYMDEIQVFPEGAATGQFPFGISPSTGEVRAAYGFTIGGGDTTFLSSQAWGNIDASGPGFINIGTGRLGNNRALVQSGSFTAADHIFLNQQSPSIGSIDLYSTSVNVLNIGNGMANDFSAIVQAGYYNAQSGFSLNGTDITIDSPAPGFIEFGQMFGTHTAALEAGSLSANDHVFINQSSPTVGSIDLYSIASHALTVGNGTASDWSAIVRAGYFNAQFGMTLNNTDIMFSSTAVGKLNIGEGSFAAFDAFVKLGELSNGGGNTDLAGVLTINVTGGICGGSATCTGFTFVHSGAYTTAPICTFYDPGSSFSPQSAVSSTGFLVFATLGDTINYHCIFREI